MVKARSWLTHLPLALLLTFVVSSGVVAQEDFSFEARGGIAVPLEDTRTLWDAGPTINGAFTYWVNSRVGLRADLGVDLLSGASASDVTGSFDVPDLSLFHYTGGFEFRALDPDEALSLNVTLGAGVTNVSSDDFPEGLDTPAPSEDSFGETYVAINGGARVGYDFHPQVSGFVGTDMHYIVTETQDFRVFSQFDPDNPDPARMNEIWTLPVYGGVAIHF